MEPRSFGGLEHRLVLAPVNNKMQGIMKRVTVIDARVYVFGLKGLIIIGKAGDEPVAGDD